MKSAMMMVALLFAIFQKSFTQGYTPKIEPCPCLIKIDSRLISRCGYLVVPENRQKAGGRNIKIPFVFVRKPEADSVKNITLFTTGGPGYSTIANYDSFRYSSGLLKYGGFIVFDQRGTKKALPCLDCPGIGIAIKRAYRENLPKDSLVMEAAIRCRKELTAQGIDLSAYNTIESADDIDDLRRALGIDSMNLFGISYSGGLMLTVARNHPAAVKSLILSSPLPGYVNYEEDGLFNINEALDQVFDNCEADSTDRGLYGNLRDRFHEYFTSISGKSFYISYVEKSAPDTLKIKYTRNELLDAIVNRLNTSQLKTVPYVMNELIKGNHEPYVREVLNGYFSGDTKISYGMRFSVYCSEQIEYANEALIRKQDEILPWLAGYPFNNVNHTICNCWKVKPEQKEAKSPVYSRVPAIIAGGDADPWCRPFYNRLIKRYMPNSQLLLVHDQGHLPNFSVDGEDFIKMFFENPYKKLVSASKNAKVE